MSRAAIMLGLVAATLLWPAATARADFLLADNNAEYALGDIPAGAFGDAADTGLRPDGAVDHLNEDWWWFREAGDSHQTAFHSPTSEVVSGNTATLGFSEANFSATINYLLTDGAAPGEATISQTLSVTNTSAGALIIDLFHYADINVGGTAAGESATLESPNRIRVADGGPFFVFHEGVGAIGWEVSNENTLDFEDLLEQNPLVFNTTSGTLPFGPADINSIFQYRLTLDPGETGGVTSVIDAKLVPTPASLMLLAPAVVLMLKRRRHPTPRP